LNKNPIFDHQTPTARTGTATKPRPKFSSIVVNFPYVTFKIVDPSPRTSAQTKGMCSLKNIFVGASTSVRKENFVISFARQLWMSYLMCYAAWIYFYLFISEEVRGETRYYVRMFW